MTERNFDIEKIKAGAKVVDRDGGEWQYVGVCNDPDYPYVFWQEGFGINNVTKDGRISINCESDYDLTIVPTKKKLFIAVGKLCMLGVHDTSSAYENIDEVLTNMTPHQIVKIEIEV